ncbi:MAG: TVP38/TMEM64 family protein [Lachnospiraceae bacterium]|nr:TVP38/TMEM64 family protein [Candidatus Colinaster equi]
MKKYKNVIRIVALVLALTLVIILGILTYKFATDKENFKIWMDNRGVLGYVAYVCMVILQIFVAVIPGGPLEMAGGYAFGALLGSILFLIGATIGSILVFTMVRRFGHNFVEIFFKKEKIKQLDFLKEEKKREILFAILFVIPGSPKDLLCYVAGLSEFNPVFFILVATLGRIPAVVATSISGEAMGGSKFLIAIVVLAVVLVVSGIGALICSRIMNKKNEKSKND